MVVLMTLAFVVSQNCFSKIVEQKRSFYLTKRTFAYIVTGLTENRQCLVEHDNSTNCKTALLQPSAPAPAIVVGSAGIANV